MLSFARQYRLVSQISICTVAAILQLVSLSLSIENCTCFSYLEPTFNVQLDSHVYKYNLNNIWSVKDSIVRHCSAIGQRGRTKRFRCSSKSNDASLMIFALVRTRNSNWYSSVTVRGALVLTNAWRTFALSRSNHLWRVISLSRGPANVTSAGPHRENSRMDFTYVENTDFRSVSGFFWINASWNIG